MRDDMLWMSFLRCASLRDALRTRIPIMWIISLSEPSCCKKPGLLKLRVAYRDVHVIARHIEM